LYRYNKDANIRLIDNDNLLGQQVFDKAKNRLCAVSSLFLPGNMVGLHKL
jgi:hypothetical protein